MSDSDSSSESFSDSSSESGSESMSSSESDSDSDSVSESESESESESVSESVSESESESEDETCLYGYCAWLGFDLGNGNWYWWQLIHCANSSGCPLPNRNPAYDGEAVSTCCNPPPS